MVYADSGRAHSDIQLIMLIYTDRQPKEKAEKEAKGKAYGKDKDGLVGKEFGMARAEEAKER
mgnify:CR=1 FL=1